MIGSTDGHNSLSTTQEDNFFGKFPESEPSKARTKNAMANNRLWQNWRIVSSGYAAVWATENTRAALFDAMKRREVYATTGSRITVRFFGGWEYTQADLEQPNYLDIAFNRGVPMGGDLIAERPGKTPTFMVMAAKDPDGANLDRIQIIKGWVGKDGQSHEQIYDVSWSGQRQPDPNTGKLPSVGSTVNVDLATFSNTIGAPQLGVVWSDPSFDPAQRAFYYARVLEIPRPRWTAYDAAYFDMDLSPEVPLVIQDRAYTSPIWYTP